MKKILLLCCLLLPCAAALGEESYLYPAKGESGLWGYIDETGAWAVSPAFSFAGEFRGGYAEASLPAAPGKSGVVDRSGAFVLEPKYLIDSGYDGGYYGGRDTGIFYVSGEGGAGFFDIPSGHFSGLQWDGLFAWIDEDDPSPDALVPVMSGAGGAGYAARGTGETVIPFRYQGYDPALFCEGFCVTALEDDEGEMLGDYLLLNAKGESVALPEQAELFLYGRVSCGLLRYKDKETGLIGFLNTAGQIAVPAVYQAAGDFSQGYAVVLLNDAMRRATDATAAVIDQSGQIVCAGFSPDDADAYSLPACENGFITFLQDGVVSIVNVATGAHVGLDIGNVWDVYPVMENGLAWYMAKQGGYTYYGLISSEGRLVREADLLLSDWGMRAFEFRQGLYPARDGKWGYIDEQGRFAISPAYDAAGGFYGPLAFVVKGERQGYINAAGREVYMWEK